MLSSTYDYTRYVLRTDPTCPVTAAEADDLASSTPALTAALSGSFTGTLPVITGIWADVSPDRTALHAMISVAMDFIDVAERRGFSHWADVSTAVVEDFVREPHPLITDDARRLRKNAVHACYLALVDAGRHWGLSPAEGIDPVPNEVRADERGKRRGNASPEKTRRRYSERTHVRPASHDEILLTRLASRLAGSSRALNLAAAAVAVCAVSATTAEAPQILWVDLSDNGVALAGRASAPGCEETAIHARTVGLDGWATQVLRDWREERSTVRPVRPDDSVLYSGNQALTSTSAQAGVDQQVRKALEIADLRREPGLTSGSLRLWAAARLVVDFPTLADGAIVAGVDPHTLHRRVTQQGDRGLRLNY